MPVKREKVTVLGKNLSPSPVGRKVTKRKHTLQARKKPGV